MRVLLEVLADVRREDGVGEDIAPDLVVQRQQQPRTQYLHNIIY